jgi:hypothetical protein
MAHPFDHVMPTPEQHAAMTAIGEAFKPALAALEAMPPSRHRSLALTDLESAMMWAKRGVMFPPTQGDR